MGITMSTKKKSRVAAVEARELRTEQEVAPLLVQKAAHDKLVSAVSERARDLANEIERLRQTRYAVYTFFTEKHPELLEEFVNVAYKECDDKMESHAVSGFHDDGVLDMSTIKCTGDDFDPWED